MPRQLCGEELRFGRVAARAGCVTRESAQRQGNVKTQVLECHLEGAHKHGIVQSLVIQMARVPQGSVHRSNVSSQFVPKVVVSWRRGEQRDRSSWSGWVEDSGFQSCSGAVDGPMEMGFAVWMYYRRPGFEGKCFPGTTFKACTSSAECPEGGVRFDAGEWDRPTTLRWGTGGGPRRGVSVFDGWATRKSLFASRRMQF